MSFFSMTSMEPYKGEVKTLRLKNYPKHGMGNFEDENGVRWCVEGLCGNGHVWAIESSHKYYSTSAFDNQSRSCTWIPYKVESI